MHAYANPEHERWLRDIVAERYPDLPVSLSSEILPEFREYDRAPSTVMNDYVRPIMKRYLSPGSKIRLQDEHVKAKLHIDVRSDGGLMSAAAASERPVHGSFQVRPAACSTVMIAPNRLQKPCFRYGRHFDRRLGHFGRRADNRPDISRRRCPRWTCAASAPAADRSLKSPELTKSLRVGPRSAGAKPGPVTRIGRRRADVVGDANVVLGFSASRSSRR